MKTKVCSKCKIEKPYSEYFKDNKRKIGIRCRCKTCSQAQTMEWRGRNKSEYNNYAAYWRSKNPGRQHATDIKRHYGLSLEEYNRMLSDQACGCKICGKQHDPSIKRGRLYVDHCHESGKVRALLCGACNSAIGHFDDKIELLHKAIEYLNSYS